MVQGPTQEVGQGSGVSTCQVWYLVGINRCRVRDGVRHQVRCQVKSTKSKASTLTETGARDLPVDTGDGLTFLLRCGRVGGGNGGR